MKAKRILFTAAAFTFACLTLCCMAGGCFSADQRSRMNTKQDGDTLPRALPVELPPDDRASSRPGNPVLPMPAASHVESQASNNATQQSQELGVQIAKLGEKVTGIENSFDSLVKVQATATANAIAEIRAKFEAQMDAQTAANAKAQVGFGNDIKALENTVKAGRDSVQTTMTEYTPEMAKTERYAFWTILGVISLFMGSGHFRAWRERVRHDNLLKQHMALLASQTGVSASVPASVGGPPRPPTPAI